MPPTKKGVRPFWQRKDWHMQQIRNDFSRKVKNPIKNIDKPDWLKSEKIG